MKSELFFARVLGDGGENGNQLIGFVNDRFKFFRSHQSTFSEKAKPVMGLACFLAGDIHFRSEIGFALAAVCFFDVGSNGCSSSKKLVRETA